MSEVLCDDMVEEVEGSSSDDDDEQRKGVCDICDDGGNVLWSVFNVYFSLNSVLYTIYSYYYIFDFTSSLRINAPDLCHYLQCLCVYYITA